MFLVGLAQGALLAFDTRQQNPIKRYKGTLGQMLDIEFLNDNRTFVTSSDYLRHTTPDAGVIVWDFESV